MSRHKKEFGDFQTPASLAREVVAAVAAAGIAPATIVEPTCGTGTLLEAAFSEFPAAQRAVGLEVNGDYLEAARQRLERSSATLDLLHANFFDFDWLELLVDTPQPVLFIGNPPWVTNSTVGAIGGANLPAKQNSAGARGIEALTGASNFDVSEFVIWRMLEQLERTRGLLAMLCKTSVARRLLRRCWSGQLPFDGYQMQRIDASAAFGATVDACLLLVANCGQTLAFECRVSALGQPHTEAVIGWRDDRLVADAERYDRSVPFFGGADPLRWRSGIKHDCAAVFELRERAGALVNGFDERVEIESECLFPMLKSAALLADSNQVAEKADRWLLVTQRKVGDDTAPLRTAVPKTWRYLEQHADQLQRRASRIYRGRPPFSIFGVGDYAFRPWKVAVSGFAKRARFHLVGPRAGKPVMFDDTCYFVSFDSEEAARRLYEALNSRPVRDAIESLIFTDAKRPITAAILNQISPIPDDQPS